MKRMRRQRNKAIASIGWVCDQAADSKQVITGMNRARATYASMLLL